MKEEKHQSKIKEKSYDQIISTLKHTAEENSKRREGQTLPTEAGKGPSSKDLKDTLDELNVKKEEVNSLEEKILYLELKAEKVALDHKIKI